jgi:asparagine synthase (glutamine-hydrolysing)
MCGIFALLNNDGIRLSPSYIEEEFMIGKKRGPEFSKLSRAMVGLDFGFHRLAINGLNDISHQPIQYNNITLICNGEIYNYKKLYEMMEDVFPHTDSDCEVIIHLYLKYGIDQTLQMLDGVFAFCLLDNTNPGNDAKLYVARDPYGVRPLYIMKPLFESTKKNVDNIYGFASELKVLCNINERLNVENRIKNDIWIFEHPSFTRKHPHFTIEQFVPGTYNIFSVPCDKPSNWTLTQKTRYHLPGFRSCLYNNNSNVGYIIPQIQSYLKSAVEKRCVSTERPIACLLSGGLDSSLITALVNEYHTKHNLPKNGSVDILKTRAENGSLISGFLVSFSLLSGFIPTTGGKSKGDWKQVARKIKDGVYHEEDLQKINRYYISKNGVKIVKVNKTDQREIQLEAGRWLQEVFNDIKIQPKWENYDIDKKYYLEAIEQEINGIIDVSSNQLKLF